jgi:Tol biopolymer transport system component
MMKANLCIASAVFFIALLPSCSESDPITEIIPFSEGDFHIEGRWASSVNLNISIDEYGKERKILTTGNRDFKPSWSKTGNMLTFFRRYSYNSSGFHTWRTKICVINQDGSGFRELTGGSNPDFNPTWTRDGSNHIIFNRYTKGTDAKGKIYMMAPDDDIGDEVLISHPDNLWFEWACSGLIDGRIFVDRLGDGGPRCFLLTPDPGNAGKYEEVSRPTEKVWHKLSISPSEKKVCYMLDNNGDIPSYNDCVIAIADLDLANRRIFNQVIITEENLNNIYEYPRWTSDEAYVIYDSNKSGRSQVYAYHLETRKTSRISEDPGRHYQFANYEYCPK